MIAPFARIDALTDPTLLVTDALTGKVYVRARSSISGELSTEFIDFGVVDGRCRKIGAKITTYRVDRVPTHGTDSLLAPDSLGTGWFALDIRATRNGFLYGASQETRYFESATARSIATDRYLADARKRAAR